MSDKMKDKIKEIAFTFAWVTTFIVMANGIVIAVFYQPNGTVSAWTFAAIIGTAAATSLCNLIYPTHVVSKKIYRLLVVVHFCLILGIVMGAGTVMGWVAWNDPLEVLFMILVITLIYVAVTALNVLRDKRLADAMNQKLSYFNEEEKKD